MKNQNLKISFKSSVNAKINKKIISEKTLIEVILNGLFKQNPNFQDFYRSLIKIFKVLNCKVSWKEEMDSRYDETFSNYVITDKKTNEVILTIKINF